mmetsp:Transcript_10390/g.11436  ORF Transcript_10390/g.11436 Transcript_10390/m.11436 type:complete len:84 (-) Transcript_10390:170-421(-)
MVTKKTSTRGSMFKLLSRSFKEDPEPLSPEHQSFSCKAVRLRANKQKVTSIIGIDGEKTDWTNIHAEMMPRFINIFCRPTSQV